VLGVTRGLVDAEKKQKNQESISRRLVRRPAVQTLNRPLAREVAVSACTVDPAGRWWADRRLAGAWWLLAAVPIQGVGAIDRGEEPRSGRSRCPRKSACAIKGGGHSAPAPALRSHNTKKHPKT